MDVKAIYNVLEKAMERCQDNEAKIVNKLETQAKILNPNVEFGNMMYMKLYF